MTSPELSILLAERRIERVITDYTRAVDRRDLEAVRACYWPDGFDWHGAFRGDTDEFIDWLAGKLPEFATTMHYVTNLRVDVDESLESARAESYLLAYHRLAEPVGDEPTDVIVGLRYVDRFEHRDGQWRIAARVCAYEWRRQMPGQDTGAGPSHVLGRHDDGDVLHWIMDADLGGRRG